MTTKQKGDKGGRPKVILIEAQKTLSIIYVKSSGLWKVRLAKLLRMDLKTLSRILREDRSFSLDLEAADAEFAGNIIARAKPEFILKTKYKDEFPETTISDADKGLNEAAEAALARMAKVLSG